MASTRIAIKRWFGRGMEAHFLFPLFGILMLIVIWGGTLYLNRMTASNAHRVAMEVGRELTETYTAQVIRSLAQIDQTLRTVRYGYQLTGQASSLAVMREKGLLLSPLIFTVRITDRNGLIIASTHPEDVGAPISKQHIAAHRKSGIDIPFVGPVAVNAVTNDPEFQISRRLNDINGQFGGIVAVSVHPDYFTSGYERSRMGDKGALGLLGPDGFFRVIRKGERVTWNEAAPVAFLRKPGTSTLDDSLDGTRRYMNFSPLHGFPLTVVLGLPQDEQMKTDRENMRTYVWAAVIASLLVISIVGLLSGLAWQLNRNRQRMRLIQQTYHAASESSLDGFFVFRNVVDKEGRIIDFVLDEANSRAVSFAGIPRSMLLGSSLSALLPDARSNGVLDKLRKVAQTGTVLEQECRNLIPGAAETWLHCQVVKVDCGVVAIVRDITDRKRNEILHSEQARILEMIATGASLQEVLQDVVSMIENQLPHFSGAIMLVDNDGRHLRHEAGNRLPASFMQGLNRMPIGPEAASCGTAVYRRTAIVCADIRQDPLWNGYQELAAQHGLRSSWSTPIFSEHAEVVGTLDLYSHEAHWPDKLENELVNMAVRISALAMERKHAEERIRHMAHHDALTGLPNRTLLEDRIQQAILHAKRYKHPITVAFIDLDNFKLVNDTLGHKAGDELLVTLARRMTQCMRSSDTVVRLGGDEFVLILTDQADNTGNIVPMLERIRDRLCDPVLVGNQELQVTYSMGLARYPDDGDDADTLLMHADAAMYRAKELGRNNYHFYTPDLNSRNQEKIILQEALRHAVANDQLFLVYQPKIDLLTGQIFGVEALVRWRHPKHGVISPAKFIPLAEEGGEIIAIGMWVLRQACRQNKAWQISGAPPVTISVNVSARQFMADSLIRHVAEALRESQLEPRYLELEVTESVIMEDVPRAIRMMQQLQSMGIMLSIDDFGIGYSSLSALKNFPIARLKIDKSFVRDIPYQEDDTFIVKAVISLAHKLNLKVLAEGVESNEQLDFLADNGCDEIQGYHFSDPVSDMEIEKFLKIQARRNEYLALGNV